MAAKNINDLNDFCLINVFKFLTTTDWLTLCCTTKRFSEIVKNHVVKQNEVVFKSRTMQKAIPALFQTFGKHMTKLSFDFHIYGFNEFLQMCLDYCTPGLLSELTVEYCEHEDGGFNHNLAGETAKYFKNIKSLRCTYIDWPNEWLTAIPTHQVISLQLYYEATDDFRLNPDAFPSLIDLVIAFDLDPNKYYPRHAERSNAVTEFITKLNLRKLYFFGINLKKISENCPNISSLGQINIKSAAVGAGVGNRIEWNVLGQLEHLETISFTIELFNWREFQNIVNALANVKKLKTLFIHFSNEPELQSNIICDGILAFLKSNGNQKIVVLEYVEVFLDCDIEGIVGQQLWHMLTDVLNVKTICLVTYIIEPHAALFSLIVERAQSLEHFCIDGNDSAKNLSRVWRKMMMAKVSTNNLLGIRRKLTIYVKEKFEGKIKSDVSSLYDPQVIEIASHSHFARRSMKGRKY